MSPTEAGHFEEGSSGGADGGRIASLVRLFGPTTLLTGLLYYYGYVSLKAYYAYFGISLSALDLSPNDYLVRTPDTLFRPIALLMVIVIVGFVIHHLLAHVLKAAAPRIARRVAVGVGAASAVLAVVAWIGMFASSRGVASPIALIAAALFFEYALWLLTRYGAPSPRWDDWLHAGVDLRRGLVIALVLIGSFWAVNERAQDRGVENARLTELSLSLQPQAVVYSAQDLQLDDGPDVKTELIDGEDSAFAFRYSGLRPLLYANDRWFLLPVGWRKGLGATVIVLHDDPAHVRVDLAPSS